MAFALALLLQSIPIFRGLSQYFFSIPMHEMGHAVAAWLGSRWALPVGAWIPMAGMTYTLQGRSELLFALELFAIGALWVKARNLNLVFLSGLSLAAFLALVYWTWIAPSKSWEEFMLWGGVGGEFALSTLFILAFYHRLPDRVRWDFFRFPFLLAGAFSFLEARSRWERIRLKKESIPWGTMIDGRSDPLGDMDRLKDQFGWSASDIASSYASLGNVCLALILIHVGIFGWVAYLRHREAQGAE